MTIQFDPLKIANGKDDDIVQFACSCDNNIMMK